MTFLRKASLVAFALSNSIAAVAVVPPTSSPPVGGAITQPNYALTACSHPNEPNIGVFWVRLPGKMTGKQGRDVWHRASHFETGDDPTMPAAYAHRNRPDRKERFDIFFQGAGFPASNTGNVIVRLVAPKSHDYRFYVDKVAGVYGVGKVNPSDSAVCKAPGSFPKSIDGSGLYVTSFVIDRYQLPVGSCSEFNIAVEKAIGPADHHEGVHYLDPKVHNDGNPMMC